MTHCLLYTHHAIALWRQHQALLATVAARQDVQLQLCLPVVGEMWYRIYNTPHPAESQRTLHEFLERFTVLEYDTAAAIEFGLIKTAMQRIRRPISDVDTQLAAIARSRDLTVLSAEQHFCAIPRLKVENWLAGAPRAIDVRTFINQRSMVKREEEAHE
jgi:tRNA(fMet)-specific endonuclease VapC